MSQRVKFELNRAGVAELMKSAEMQNVLMGYARNMQSRAGDGYKTSAYVGKTRANVSVIASSKKANRDNLKNNTLLRAMR